MAGMITTEGPRVAAKYQQNQMQTCLQYLRSFRILEPCAMPSQWLGTRDPIMGCDSHLLNEVFLILLTL